MQPSIKYAVYLITGISLALLPGCSSLKGGTAGGKAADPPPRKGSTVPEVNATPEEIVTELYLTCYTRPPTAEEMKIATGAFTAEGATRRTATEDVLWSLLNSAEFVFNH